MANVSPPSKTLARGGSVISVIGEPTLMQRKQQNERWGEPAYLPPAYCAHQLGYVPGWAFNLIADGRLAAVRVNGKLRVPREAWHRWLAENVEPVS